MTSIVVKTGECEDNIQLQYFKTDTLNFTEAQLVCEGLRDGGSLAVPKDGDFFLRMYQFKETVPNTSFAWVGLIDPIGSNILESQVGVTERFVSVVDGVAPTFTSGAAGAYPWLGLSDSVNFSAPRDLKVSQDCIMMSDKLVDSNCSSVEDFICQLPCILVNPPSAVDECENNVQLQYFRTRLTFNKAQLACEILGVNGSLAVPTDREFFNRMVSIRPLNGWVGFFDPNGPNILESQGGNIERFVSVFDGTPNNLTAKLPWAANDYLGEEDCARFVGGNSLFDDNCDIEHSFLCQVSCTPNNTAPNPFSTSFPTLYLTSFPTSLPTTSFSTTSFPTVHRIDDGDSLISTGTIIAGLSTFFGILLILCCYFIYLRRKCHSDKTRARNILNRDETEVVTEVQYEVLEGEIGIIIIVEDGDIPVATAAPPNK